MASRQDQSVHSEASGTKGMSVCLICPDDPFATGNLLSAISEKFNECTITILTKHHLKHLEDFYTLHSNVGSVVYSQYTTHFLAEDLPFSTRFDYLVFPLSLVSQENLYNIMHSCSILGNNLLFIDQQFNFITIQSNFTRSSRYPSVYVIAASSKCNISCIMCAAGDRRVSFGENLELELFHTFLENLDASEAEQTFAFVAEGEQLMNKEFLAMVRATKQRNFNVSLTTNGNLINKKLADKLVASGLDEIRFSIDADHQELYEKIRSGAKWSRLTGGLKALVESKKRHCSKTPIMKCVMVGMQMNIHCLPGLTIFAAEHGMDEVIVNQFMPNPRVEDQSLLEQTGLLNTYFAEAQGIAYEVGVKVSLDEADLYNREYLSEKDPAQNSSTPQNFTRLCHDPWQTAHILPNGDIIPCCGGIKEPLGSLRTKTFKQIWHGSAYQTLRYQLLSGKLGSKCATCALRPYSSLPELRDSLHGIVEAIPEPENPLFSQLPTTASLQSSLKSTGLSLLKGFVRKRILVLRSCPEKQFFELIKQLYTFFNIHDVDIVAQDNLVETIRTTVSCNTIYDYPAGPMSKQSLSSELVEFIKSQQYELIIIPMGPMAMETYVDVLQLAKTMNGSKYLIIDAEKKSSLL